MADSLDDPTDPTDPNAVDAVDAGDEPQEQAMRDTMRMIQHLQRIHATRSAYYAQMTNPLRATPPLPSQRSSKLQDRESVADSLVAASNLRFLCVSYPDLFRILVGDNALECFVVGCSRTTHMALAIQYATLTSATAMQEVYPRDRYLFGRYYMDNLLPRPVGLPAPNASPWLLPVARQERETMPSISELYDLTERIAHVGMPLPPRYRQHPDGGPAGAEEQASSLAATSPGQPGQPERLVIYPLCISHLPVINQRSTTAINEALDIHRALCCSWPCERASFLY